MSSPIPTTTSEIFDTNPYESHQSLSPLEAEVLWEYAKLSQHISDLTSQTRKLSETPDKSLLVRLRVLEKKMGLVLTLFKASVWGVINEQPVSEPLQSYDGDGATADDTTTR